MANKLITVPEPIKCINMVTKEPLERLTVAEERDEKGHILIDAVFELDLPWSLYRAIAIFVGTREDWVKPFNKALRLSAFLAKLDDTAPGKQLEIGEELWRNLRDTLEADDFEISYPYNLQLPPLFVAILDARDVVESECPTT